MGLATGIGGEQDCKQRYSAKTTKTREERERERERVFLEMEEYPEELRSPPVSLVAVVGCAELHQAITTHLHSQQPPINSLALPDISKISFLLAPNPNKTSGSDSPASAAGGILKRDWLQKHRTRIPSAVAALFSSDCISGDPAQWLRLCSDLDELKYSFTAKKNKFALFFVLFCF